MAVAARNADLEAAIAADIDDAGAYLVYADWLQTRGDPRGELIVVQHALETARGPAWARLKIRERELLTAHGEHLLGPGAAPRYWRHFDWRRGFVDRMHAEFVLDEGEQLIGHPSLALVRALGNVEFSRIQEVAPPLLDELAVEYETPRVVLARGALRHVALLGYAWASLGVAVPDDAALATSRLETLVFGAGAALLRDLASCQFPALRTVRTSCDDDADAEAIAAFVLSTPYAELDLELSGSDDDASATVLDDVAVRRRVRALRLDDPTIAVLQRLRTQLRRLEALELSGMLHWSPDLIAELPIAPRLLHLSLEDQLTDPAAVAALARSPYAATLETLKLRLHDRIAHGGLRHGVFPALRKLDIEWASSDLRSSDSAALSETFPAVREITVRHHRLSDVADSGLAANVETLTVLPIRSVLRVDQPFAREIEKFPALRVLRIAGEPQPAPAAFETLGALHVAIEVAPNVPPLVAAR
ncbi:MAG TPA: TIGR02996 domain-containing protein [Kofleriaceae bacterium]